MFFHSRGEGGQTWVKFGPHSCWMTPVWVMGSAGQSENYFYGIRFFFVIVAKFQLDTFLFIFQFKKKLTGTLSTPLINLGIPWCHSSTITFFQLLTEPFYNIKCQYVLRNAESKLTKSGTKVFWYWPISSKNYISPIHPFTESHKKRF